MAYFTIRPISPGSLVGFSPLKFVPALLLRGTWLISRLTCLRYLRVSSSSCFLRTLS